GACGHAHSRSPAPMLNQRAGVCVPAERPAAGGDRHRGGSVTQQTVARGMNSALVNARGAAPEFAVRFAGALMAVAVAAVHVADQGGITVMADPAWIGWGYRLIEVGGVLTALILLLPRQAWPGPGWLGWAAGRLLGARPPPGLTAHPPGGLPGDPADSGHWAARLGTGSLLGWSRPRW